MGQGNIFRSMCQEFCSQVGSPGPHPGGGWGVWPEGGSPGPHPEGRLRGLAKGGSPGPHPEGGWGDWLGGLKACTRRVSRPTPRGVQAQAWGRVYPSMHWGRNPPSRRLLLRAVRILLECILVKRKRWVIDIWKVDPHYLDLLVPLYLNSFSIWSLSLILKTDHFKGFLVWINL